MISKQTIAHILIVLFALTWVRAYEDPETSPVPGSSNQDTGSSNQGTGSSNQEASFDFSTFNQPALIRQHAIAPLNYLSQSGSTGQPNPQQSDSTGQPNPQQSGPAGQPYLAQYNPHSLI